jgi:hypothetical protein
LPDTEFEPDPPPPHNSTVRTVPAGQSPGGNHGPLPGVVRTATFRAEPEADIEAAEEAVTVPLMAARTEPEADMEAAEDAEKPPEISAAPEADMEAAEEAAMVPVGLVGAAVYVMVIWPPPATPT